jgi:hypothetical protein
MQFLYYYYYLLIYLGGRGGSYRWAIPCNACNNTTNRISSHTDSIYSFDHLVSIFWIWAPNNITLNLVIFYTGESQANVYSRKKNQENRNWGMRETERERMEMWARNA